MNTRVLLLAGLLATAAIAFSGSVAEHTGVEFTESAEASCILVTINGQDHCVNPSCTVAGAVEAVTGEPQYCTE